MSDTCQAHHIPSVLPLAAALMMPRHCIEPATVTLEAGCIHEHVKRKRFCAEHGRINPAPGWLCRECADAGHECRVAPRVVQDA